MTRWQFRNQFTHGTHTHCLLTEVPTSSAFERYAMQCSFNGEENNYKTGKIKFLLSGFQFQLHTNEARRQISQKRYTNHRVPNTNPKFVREVLAQHFKSCFEKFHQLLNMLSKRGQFIFAVSFLQTVIAQPRFSLICSGDCAFTRWYLSGLQRWASKVEMEWLVHNA